MSELSRGLGAVLLMTSSLVSGSAGATAPSDNAGLELDVRCVGQATCRYDGNEMPLEIELRNTGDQHLEVPLEFHSKTGPAIKLSLPASTSHPAKDSQLRTNLADWALKQKFVAIAPGHAVSFRWLIHASEIDELGAAGPGLVAKFDLVGSMRIGSSLKEYWVSRTVSIADGTRVIYRIDQREVSAQEFAKRKAQLDIPRGFASEGQLVRPVLDGPSQHGYVQVFDAVDRVTGKPVTYQQQGFAGERTFEISDRQAHPGSK